MGFSEIQSAIVSSAPCKDKCGICGSSLEKLASVSASVTVLLKKFRKSVCIVCAKEVRALLDLRITQAEKGEHQ